MICKPKIKKFEFSGQLQYDEQGRYTICGCKVKFLKTVYIYAKTYERAEKKAFKYLKVLFPEYGDNILIGW